MLQKSIVVRAVVTSLCDKKTIVLSEFDLVSPFFSSCGTFGVAVWTSTPDNHQLKSDIEKGVEGHSRCVIQFVWSAVRTQPLCNPVCMVCGETVPVQPELPTLPICNLKRKFAHQTIRIRRRSLSVGRHQPPTHGARGGGGKYGAESDDLIFLGGLAANVVHPGKRLV